jgi:hypothetical protein
MESAVSYWLKELQDFIQFSGRFDANIPRAIVGASKADIDRIEELAKLQIPPEYRAFLLLMGRTPPRALGNLLVNERYGVDAVVDYYSEPSTRFHDAVFLWSFEIDSPYEFFISAAAVPAIYIPHPILQFHWKFDLDTEEYQGAPGLTKVDESLLHYLYKNFFEQVRYPMFQHTIDTGQLKKSVPGKPQNLTNYLQVVESLAARFGFTKVPYINSLELFYDRLDACLLYYPSKNTPGRLLASGQDKDELTRICKIFCDTLDMQ